MLKMPNGTRNRQPSKHYRISRGAVAIILISILAIAVAIVLGLNNPLFTPSTSREGLRIDHMFDVLLAISAAILVFVDGILVYIIIRFGKPLQSSNANTNYENPTIHVLWTVIPIIVVVFLSVYSYVILADISLPRPNEMIIEVTASQWEWQFYYPENNVSSYVLHLPVNRQVLLRMHSKDVIHSLWVPAFRIKEDVEPDRITELTITPTQLGTFPLLCNRICGVGHSVMRTTVAIQTDAEFNAWLDTMTADAKATSEANETPDVTVTVTATNTISSTQ